jgi:hypothetical protein
MASVLPVATFTDDAAGWLDHLARVTRWNCRPSTYQVISPGFQSTAKVWKSSAYDQPCGCMADPVMPAPPE